MKRIYATAALFAAMAILLSTSSAFSATPGEETISVTYGVNIRVNGILFQPKDALGQNVEPFNYNGTVYVPLRAISELFGANIQWLENPQYDRHMVYLDASTAHELRHRGELPAEKTRYERSITVVKSSTIMLKTGTDNYIEHTPTDVNGNPVPIILYDGTNYVPLRDISRVFNTEIDWNGTTYTVFLGNNRDINCDSEDYHCQSRPILEQINRVYEIVNNDAEYLYNEVYEEVSRKLSYIRRVIRQLQDDILKEQLNTIYGYLRSTCYEIQQTYRKYQTDFVHGGIRSAQNYVIYYEVELTGFTNILQNITGWASIFEDIKLQCAGEVLEEYENQIRAIENSIGH